MTQRFPKTTNRDPVMTESHDNRAMSNEDSEANQYDTSQTTI